MPEPRPALTRDRVLAAAVTLADTHGLAALTMRSLAEALQVKPMSLYYHLPNKEAILDGIVDAVFAEVPLPQPHATDWQAELRARSHALRTALNRHSWALALMETRANPGLATLRHHEAMLETFRTAGFSLESTAHAYAMLDAFVYGFALQEASLKAADLQPTTTSVLATLDAAAFPRMIEFATERVLQPGYSFAASFDVGLNLTLQAITTLR